MFALLNLPPCPAQRRYDARGRIEIYDRLRGKWVVATPEEWVRQSFVHYLIDVLGYPGGLMANEVGLKLNDTSRRCDTLVYSRSLEPVMVVEYKRTTVEITRGVFDQIARYNSVIGARWLVVSNGLRHYCCRFDGDGYTFVKEIPKYENL